MKATRLAILCSLAVITAAPASSQSLSIPGKTAKSSGVTGLLGNASDSALDKLSQPGAFFADQAIRIALPGTKGNLVQKGLKFGDKIGVTNDITKSLNDAAGLAAKEAKPIFRSAIDGLSVKDIPGLVSKSDGGTRYLQDSAGSELQAKIRPLVEKALGDVGAFKQLDKLTGGSEGGSGGALGGLGGGIGGALGGLGGGLGGVGGKSLGLNRESLTDSVSKQALDGIFKYMGAEESKLRKNPLKAGKKLFGVFK